MHADARRRVQEASARRSDDEPSPAAASGRAGSDAERARERSTNGPPRLPGRRARRADYDGAAPTASRIRLREALRPRSCARARRRRRARWLRSEERLGRAAADAAARRRAIRARAAAIAQAAREPTGDRAARRADFGTARSRASNEAARAQARVAKDEGADARTADPSEPNRCAPGPARGRRARLADRPRPDAAQAQPAAQRAAVGARRRRAKPRDSAARRDAVRAADGHRALRNGDGASAKRLESRGEATSAPVDVAAGRGHLPRALDLLAAAPRSPPAKLSARGGRADGASATTAVGARRRSGDARTLARGAPRAAPRRRARRRALARRPPSTSVPFVVAERGPGRGAPKCDGGAAEGGDARLHRQESTRQLPAADRARAAQLPASRASRPRSRRS